MSHKLVSRICSGALLFAITNVIAAPVVSTADDQATLSMTIYQQGLALIRDERTVDIPLGRTQLNFTGVSNQIIPESLLLSAQGLTLKEAAYTKASLTKERLLNSYVGRSVRVMHRNEHTGELMQEEGVLLGANAGIPIVEVDGRIEVGGPGASWWVAFDAVPDELHGKDSLSLDLDNTTRGPQSLTSTYLSRGLSWQANYVGHLHEDDSLSLSAWVTIDNSSDTRYSDARVQLLAGDINQASGVRPMMAMARQEAVQADMPSSPVGDYHLYDLPDAVTLQPGQKQQMRLFAERSVFVEREYRAESDGSRRNLEAENIPVGIRLHIENKGQELGMPLPAGLVRIYADDAQGMSQFLGEDRIAHTAKNQSMKLRVGNAFDIQAKKTTARFRRIDSKTIELEQKILVSNAKDTPVEVVIAERLPGEWDVLSSNESFEKISASLAEWRLELPEDGEKELTYHVRIRQ